MSQDELTNSIFSDSLKVSSSDWIVYSTPSSSLNEASIKQNAILSLKGRTINNDAKFVNEEFKMDLDKESALLIFKSITEINTQINKIIENKTN